MNTALDRDRQFFVGISRAFGGAIFFSLPMLMTLEMWAIGAYMDRLRLAGFMTLMVPLLIGLDHYAGFEKTSSWGEDVLDGFVGYGVGILSATVVLLLFSVIGREQSASEIVGRICLQAVPAALGAVLASSQFGGGEKGENGDDRDRQDSAGYGAQIFFMTVGAVFLCFSIAPTEEVVLIASMISPWNAIALILVSLAMMHGFVYAVNFRGSPRAEPDASGWGLFLRFTLVGYAAAMAVSAYVLWTFGRFDGDALPAAVLCTIVLAFPTSLGAAAARLIL